MNEESGKTTSVEVRKKPLSYECLRSVLAHMEANKRFEMARRMPSIRNVEKSVPLTIDHLSFGKFDVQINKTWYRLRVFRQFEKGHSPSDEIDYENEKGGAKYDFDEFGFREISDDMIVTPGDVQMKQEGFGTKHTKEDSQRELETYADFIAGTGPVRGLENDDPELTWGRIHLLQCHVNGTPPPYTAFLQLLVRKDYEEPIERALYKTKLYLTMKNLTTQFFGNRSNPQIFVRNFAIQSTEQTIRLPFGVKFIIQNLQVPDDSIKSLKILDPVIHESSYPLNQLIIAVNRFTEFKNAIKQPAKRLVIADGGCYFRRFFKLLPTNSHMAEGSWFSENAVELVAFWLETHKPIGFRFTVGFRNEQIATRDLRMFAERMDFEYEVKEERLLVIPINDASKLKISAEAAKAELYDNSFKQPWNLKMEVVPAVDN